MLKTIPCRIEEINTGYKKIAVVDLGSNGFRLQIGCVFENQILSLNTFKEPVYLASGLTEDKLLDIASRQRALEALCRFSNHLDDFQPEIVRAVATNTLRIAKNALDFLPHAEELLGFPIEIIDGHEEARLIYIGVAHSQPRSDHQRLVIDIGGGATEFIIGKKIEPLLTESLSMGCFSYSSRFFPDGTVDEERFCKAEQMAAQEIKTIARHYQRLGWREAIGSSGSARAIANLLELNQLNPKGASGISRQGLETLRARMVCAGSAKAMDLEGLPTNRLPLLPGGLAIMCAVFSGFGIEHMSHSEGTLRLGVLYDLLGRFQYHSEHLSMGNLTSNLASG